jgi:hypothetical protein
MFHDISLSKKVSKRYRKHYGVYKRNSFVGEAAAQTMLSN